MNDAKYIGLDVHQATVSAEVLDSNGKVVMKCVLETKAATILQFIHGLRGSLHVTFEEGTCAAWLHDLLKPYVAQVLMCDNHIISSHNWGWTARPFHLRLTVVGEAFVLTSPFIERDYRNGVKEERRRKVTFGQAGTKGSGPSCCCLMAGDVPFV